MIFILGLITGLIVSLIIIACEVYFRPRLVDKVKERVPIPKSFRAAIVGSRNTPERICQVFDKTIAEEEEYV